MSAHVCVTSEVKKPMSQKLLCGQNHKHACAWKKGGLICDVHAAQHCLPWPVCLLSMLWHAGRRESFTPFLLPSSVCPSTHLPLPLIHPFLHHHSRPLPLNLSQCRGHSPLYWPVQLQLASCIADPQCFENLACLQLCNGREDEAGCQVSSDCSHATLQ